MEISLPYYMQMLCTTNIVTEHCRSVFLDEYNRTTNWDSGSKEPTLARVVISFQSTVHIPAYYFTAVLAFLALVFIAAPQTVHLCHVV